MHTVPRYEHEDAGARQAADGDERGEGVLVAEVLERDLVRVRVGVGVRFGGRVRVGGRVRFGVRVRV